MAALLTRLGLSTGVRKVIQRWGPRRYLSSKLTEKWVNTPVRASKCLLGREDERSKVLMIYTGGTIGMASSNKGLMPLEGFLEDKIMNMEDISGNPKMPMVDILRWEELLDSSNMDSNGWAKLARQIEKYYLDYDGFVILHGTDTMAYSASALSFMFENLGKPVILTGSQIPLSEVYNDARRNLLVSLIFAGMSEIPEVCIFFETRLFRGNRSKKVDSQGLAAFDSPNFPPLATLRNDIRIRQDLIRPQPHRKLKIHTKVTNDIAVLHLVPGFDDTFIHQMAQSNLEGVVLHLYGTGNAPSMKASLIQAIERIRDDGTPVVAVSQCLRGSVDMGYYKVGRKLLDLGVLNGGDMTIEAACTKLGNILSRNLPKELFISAMKNSLRGEVSAPDDMINSKTHNPFTTLHDGDLEWRRL